MPSRSKKVWRAMRQTPSKAACAGNVEWLETVHLRLGIRLRATVVHGSIVLRASAVDAVRLTEALNAQVSLMQQTVVAVMS